MGTDLSRGAVRRVEEVGDMLHEVALLHLHAVLLQLVHIAVLCGQQKQHGSPLLTHACRAPHSVHIPAPCHKQHALSTLVNLTETVVVVIMICKDVVPTHNTY